MVYEYTKPRGPIAAMYSSPGPCYGLPGLVGERTHDPRSVHYKGPAYSFGLRHGKWRDEAGPGPAYYPNTKIYRNGRDGSPHYSLYGRHRDGTLYKTPGPGSYAPESSGQASYGRAPAYSFGVRGANRRTDTTPGPNAYSIDPMLGRTIRSSKKQAPNYTISGRSNVGSFCQDMAKTPGPGAYGTITPAVYKQKPPAYSMTGRNAMPGDSTTKPGPGAHSPERVYGTKKVAPAFSFGIRHSQYSSPMIVEAV